MQPYRITTSYTAHKQEHQWAPLPDPKVAACAIGKIERLFPKSPEPYRRAAWELGWCDLDGTPRWDAVMDLVGDAFIVTCLP